VSGCAAIERLLAAAAFDALDADESRAVDLHVAECDECRRELDALRALRPLLDVAGGVHATIPAPPPLLEASVLAALPRRGVRRLPRRRAGRIRSSRAMTRRGGLLGPLAALLAAAGAALALLAGGGPGSPPTIRLRLIASSSQPRAMATALLQPRPWGTRVLLDVARLAPTRGTQVYELWFVSPRGRLSGGTFTVGPDARVRVTLAAAARPGQYTAVGITLEPDGLHPARLGPNVLRAALPS